MPGSCPPARGPARGHELPRRDGRLGPGDHRALAVHSARVAGEAHDGGGRARHREHQGHQRHRQRGRGLSDRPHHEPPIVTPIVGGGDLGSTLPPVLRRSMLAALVAAASCCPPPPRRRGRSRSGSTTPRRPSVSRRPVRSERAWGASSCAGAIWSPNRGATSSASSTSCTRTSWPMASGRSPRWWERPPGRGRSAPRSPRPCVYPPDESQVPRWRELFRRLAERYPRFFGLEVWNEAHLTHFWKPRADVRRYVRLLKAAHAGVASAGTRVPVVAGALCLCGGGPGGIGDVNFLDGMYRAGARLVRGPRRPRLPHRPPGRRQCSRQARGYPPRPRPPWRPAHSVVDHGGRPLDRARRHRGPSPAERGPPGPRAGRPGQDVPPSARRRSGDLLPLPRHHRRLHDVGGRAGHRRAGRRLGEARRGGAGGGHAPAVPTGVLARYASSRPRGG